MSVDVGGPRVLVVDDDAAFVSEASVRLKSRGYAVTSAWNSDEALRLLEEGVYDAVLLDNGLPGRMGVVVLPQLVEKARVPVILISSHPSDDLSVDAKLLGARAFLPKPMDWAALAAKLEELIRAG